MIQIKKRHEKHSMAIATTFSDIRIVESDSAESPKFQFEVDTIITISMESDDLAVLLNSWLEKFRATRG